MVHEKGSMADKVRQKKMEAIDNGILEVDLIYDVFKDIRYTFYKFFDRQS